MPKGSRAADGRDLALALLLVGLLMRVAFVQSAQNFSGIDYFQFWLVGQAAERGEIANVYAPAGRASLLEAGRALGAEQPGSQRLALALQHRQSIETFSTPLLYLLVDSFASGDYDTDLRRFQLASLAFVALAVLLLVREAGLGYTTAALVLGVLLGWSTPLSLDLRVANVNSIQLAGIAGFLWLLRRANTRWRELAAGAFAGVLTLFKPTLGLGFGFLALCWLLRGERTRLARQCAGFAIASALAIAASSAFLGSPRAWLDWLAALPGLARDADVSVALGNYSLVRVISEAGGPDLSLALLAAFTALAALAARRRPYAAAAPSPDRDALVFCLGCGVPVLALQLAWAHYYLLLAPLAIALLARARSAPAAAALLIGSILALGGPLGLWLPSSDNTTDALRYLAGAALLIGLGFADLWSEAPQVGSKAGSK